MGKKRAASKGKVMVKVEVVSKQEISKATIDRFYVHCKYCGFFLERGFDSGDVCKGRLCQGKLREDEMDII